MSPVLIGKGQLVGLRSLIKDCLKGSIPPQADDLEAIALFMVYRLTGRKVEQLADVTAQEWRTIRDSAYPDRPASWTISPRMKARIVRYLDQYRESVKGQMKLF